MGPTVESFSLAFIVCSDRPIIQLPSRSAPHNIHTRSSSLKTAGSTDESRAKPTACLHDFFVD